MSRNISVVVPVYNSENILPQLVERLKFCLQNNFSRYELILVNDGSTDNSWEVIEQQSGQNSWVRGVNLMRNFGQHNATLCAARMAKYEVIVTMDDDLQNPPEEIPKLVNQLEEGYDVVYGRPQKERHGFLRDIGSHLLKMILKNVLGAKTARNVSAFRAFNSKVRNAFEKYNSPFVSFDVLLTWGARRFTSVEVDHDKRIEGKSNYTLRKLVSHALNVLTSFSTIPLRLASLLGFIFTIFGLCILIFVVGRYFIQGGSVPGFTFLASVIAIFAGAQLFALGIIGEYIARIYIRISDRPAYVVSEVIE